LCKLSQKIAQHVIHVQGHKVKYSNCNNSAADCPISLKFCTEFDSGKARLLHMFKVKGNRSRSPGQTSRSQRNITYQQGKRSKTATDRLSDFKLATGDELNRIRTAWRRAASSCNVFVIATFSSFFLPEHGTQQPRRGQPGNLYQRFGHRWSFNNLPRHLAHLSPNFYRGSKSAIFGLIADQRSTLRCCGLDTEQDNITNFKLGL